MTSDVVGDLATWVGSVGTVATFIWSLRLHKSSIRLHKSQLELHQRLEPVLTEVLRRSQGGTGAV